MVKTSDKSQVNMYIYLHMFEGSVDSVQSATVTVSVSVTVKFKIYFGCLAHTHTFSKFKQINIQQVHIRFNSS